MLRKNYKAHLKAVHPRENSEDLTPSGQQKISDMIKNKAKFKDKTETLTLTCASTSKRKHDKSDVEEGCVLFKKEARKGIFGSCGHFSYRRATAAFF